MNLIYPLQETDDGDRPEPFSTVAELSRLNEFLEDADDAIRRCSLKCPDMVNGTTLTHLPSLVSYLDRLAEKQPKGKAQ
jgi:hypothetical protein